MNIAPYPPPSPSPVSETYKELPKNHHAIKPSSINIKDTFFIT